MCLRFDVDFFSVCVTEIEIPGLGDPQASYKKVLLNKLRGSQGQQPVSIFDRLNYGRVATGRAAAGQKRIAGNWLLKLAGNKPQAPVTPGKLEEAMARPGPAGPLPIGKLEEAMARGPKPKQPVELPPGVDPNSPNLRALGIEGVAAKPAQIAESKKVKGSAKPVIEKTSDYRLPKPTNDPVDPNELYKALEFDPDGDGEKLTAIKSPIDAIKGKKIALESKDATKRIYGKTSKHMQNDESDAFRHALWNYKMTKEFGATSAKDFADAHERTDVNKDNERLMDLYNNHVSRQLALDPKNRNRTDEEVILEAIKAGKLQLTPFNVRGGNPSDIQMRPRYRTLPSGRPR